MEAVKEEVFRKGRGSDKGRGRNEKLRRGIKALEGKSPSVCR
jgi:hypothetical protein